MKTERECELRIKIVDEYITEVNKKLVGPEGYYDINKDTWEMLFKESIKARNERHEILHGYRVYREPA